MYSEPLAAHNVPFQSAISQRNLSPITCVLLPVRSLIARVRFKAAPMGRLCESRGPLHIAGYGSADALHREQPSAAFGAGSRECPIPGAIAPALIPNRADRSLRDAQTDGRRLSGCLIALSRICGFTRSLGPLESSGADAWGSGALRRGGFGVSILDARRAACPAGSHLDLLWRNGGAGARRKRPYLVSCISNLGDSGRGPRRSSLVARATWERGSVDG